MKGRLNAREGQGSVSVNQYKHAGMTLHVPTLIPRGEAGGSEGASGKGDGERQDC